MATSQNLTSGAPASSPSVPVKDEMAELAESLMGTLAGLLGLYMRHTQEHPDDDLRILTVGHVEAQILKARRLLYGEENDV